MLDKDVKQVESLGRERSRFTAAQQFSSVQIQNELSELGSFHVAPR